MCSGFSTEPLTFSNAAKLLLLCELLEMSLSAERLAASDAAGSDIARAGRRTRAGKYAELLSLSENQFKARTRLAAKEVGIVL